ncbi:VOC family protein [Bradyrhizobium sp. 2TAF24]|uniref:VOC family protein n=1 Tax=Bradyrhizobium sp. 2TAF24 TaxID=3233011 RepID=UPI003F92212A
MTTPITGLDHVTVLTRDLAIAVDNYEALFGRGAAWRARGDGTETAIFTVGNTSLELLAASGEGPAAARVNEVLAQQGEGLASACFRVDDAERMARRLTRLQLQPEAVVEASSSNLTDGATLRWRRTRAATTAAHGVKLFFMERAAERPLSPPSTPAHVTGLDHVVVSTGDAERAAALYGARLGLDMRLDLARQDWGVRLMFFRCDDLTVEVAQRLTETAAEAADRLMGLSWRIADAHAARERLAAAGFDVSEVRQGRKPKTLIFTVRNRTCGVPTLMIQPPPT